MSEIIWDRITVTAKDMDSMEFAGRVEKRVKQEKLSHYRMDKRRASITWLLESVTLSDSCSFDVIKQHMESRHKSMEERAIIEKEIDSTLDRKAIGDRGFIYAVGKINWVELYPYNYIIADTPMYLSKTIVRNQYR